MQALAAQAAGSGQFIPELVEVAKGFAWAILEFDFIQISPLVAVLADVQGLMYVADQMHEPGQGQGQDEGSRGVSGGRPQAGRQTEDARIEFARHNPTLRIEINVMP